MIQFSPHQNRRYKSKRLQIECGMQGSAAAKPKDPLKPGTSKPGYSSAPTNVNIATLQSTMQPPPYASYNFW